MTGVKMNHKEPSVITFKRDGVGVVGCDNPVDTVLNGIFFRMLRIDSYVLARTIHLEA